MVTALPKRSSATVVVACVAIAGLLLFLVLELRPPMWTWPLVLLASGFVADALTALAHFGFDYVFPYRMPILGPISREFNDHHDAPVLDPDSLVENLTKGAYASLVASATALVLILVLPRGPAADFLLAVAVALPLWGLFFHQMHAYAHMGSSLPAEDFRQRMEAISQLPDSRAQRAALRELFATVPIPTMLRWAQRLGLTLKPERHNLHHVRFESDFSSVNGWSDPLLNPVLGPLARQLKARRVQQAVEAQAKAPLQS